LHSLNLLNNYYIPHKEHIPVCILIFVAKIMQTPVCQESQQQCISPYSYMQHMLHLESDCVHDF